MPKLTKRSLSLSEGYASNQKKDVLVQKLGDIEYQAPQYAQDICKNICRHTAEAPDSIKMTLLPFIYEACPLTHLMKRIE